MAFRLNVRPRSRQSFLPDSESGDNESRGDCDIDVWLSGELIIEDRRSKRAELRLLPDPERGNERSDMVRRRFDSDYESEKGRRGEHWDMILHLSKILGPAANPASQWRISSCDTTNFPTVSADVQSVAVTACGNRTGRGQG
jgi:hypothetical protein